MSNLPSAFKNPQGEAEYMTAYETSMRLWPVPYESMDIPSRFGSTHLVVCGPKDAPPLVLLHCFLTSLTVWAYNISDFCRNYRVYALDMMGQPSKSIPDQPIRNREEMAEWLTSVIDSLGIRQMDLVGYSYGGFAALNYAIHAPERVKKLILLSPAGGLIPLKTQFYIRGALNTLGQALHIGRLTMNSLFHWMFYEPNMKKANIRPIAECLFNQMYLGGKYFRQELLSPKNFVLPTIVYPDQELRALESPTLLLIGQQEAIYNPVAAVARARQLIPNIQAEIIPEAGHDLPVSQSETVDQQVLEFLKE
jgi:pimeloyl-ACP methyl ester carboxylesterase